MLRLLYAVLLGLVGAGIVHIAVLLLLPVVSDRDAWSRLSQAGGLYAVLPLHGAEADRRVLRSADPLFQAVACRFDLADGVTHIRGVGHLPYWSVSVYDRGGQNVYSFNDRSSTAGTLDLVVLTPAQMIEVRKDLPQAYAESVFVEAEIGEGIVVVRGFVPDASWAPIISSELGAAVCTAE
ncbi:MAG: DUF1254 domain-containing protein [Rhizobiaceae bacterium]|nr:MAG: DUF1254 domain-containing protein [Rhizobiaceae bacterium]CAG0994782.1 hypothetical protein RHIZO_02450 [Rhizobiaceae bacterium]